MARTRRRMPQAPRTRRPRADWVYRPNIYLSDGSLGDSRGSYNPVATSVPTGPANASGKILYDSVNYMQVSMGTVPVGAQMNRAGRAEARGAFIHRVQGHALVSPSTWAVGSTLNVAFAIGVFPQDSDTGAPLVEDAFTLWVEQSDPQETPAVFANWTDIVQIRRLHKAFSDNGQYFVVPLSCRIRRRLKSNECLALYTENSSLGGSFSSTGMVMQVWMRSLVSDEG